jgi:hypothetical protein
VTASTKPIWTAYSETGALSVTCPHCHAEPGKFCTRENGRVGRIPCVSRASASGVVDDDDRPRDYSEPTRADRD